MDRLGGGMRARLRVSQQVTQGNLRLLCVAFPGLTVVIVLIAKHSSRLWTLTTMRPVRIGHGLI